MRCWPQHPEAQQGTHRTHPRPFPSSRQARLTSLTGICAQPGERLSLREVTPAREGLCGVCVWGGTASPVRRAHVTPRKADLRHSPVRSRPGRGGGSRRDFGRLGVNCKGGRESPRCLPSGQNATDSPRVGVWGGRAGLKLKLVAHAAKALERGSHCNSADHQGQRGSCRRKPLVQGSSCTYGSP